MPSTPYATTARVAVGLVQVIRALEVETADSNADAGPASVIAAAVTITTAKARTTKVKQAAPGVTGRGLELVVA